MYLFRSIRTAALEPPKGLVDLQKGLREGRTHQLSKVLTVIHTTDMFLAQIMLSPLLDHINSLNCMGFPEGGLLWRVKGELTW